MTSFGLALFVYNRPDHTARVLDGLQANDIDNLYVFSDGPKTNDDEQRVQEVRSLITDIEWCDVEMVEREENLGLAGSLTAGIEHVLDDHDRIVVLEDDCVPSEGFVSFMDQCLERYEDCSEVMSATGYSPPIEIPDDYPHDVYFTHRISSWGWGTWRDAWETFEHDPMTLDEFEENQEDIQGIARKAGEDLVPMMERQLRGEIDSWAVWWAWAVVAAGGLSVVPRESYIKNIGHDGSGRHSGTDNRFDVSLSSGEPSEVTFPNEPFVDPRLNERHTDVIEGSSGTFLRKLLVKASNAGPLELFRRWRYSSR